MSTRRILVVSAIASAVVALTVTGCSSSSNEEGKDGTTGSVDLSVLGSPNPAAGEPITIGFISDGKGDKLDNTDEIKGAQAAAAGRSR